jgi:ParB family chromosome partitioning protein
MSVVELPLEAIRPNPHQPRREFPDEGLAELAASIREHGILQPLVVSPDGDGHYLLVAGERRWRAAKLAGLTTVPVVVKDLTPQQVLELALVENLQRQDLNPLEEAEAFRRLRDEAGLSAEEIGRRIGKSGAYVRNRIRLLALPGEFQQRVSTGGISARQAEAILSALSVPPETRERVLQSPGWDSLTRAVQRGASSDELRYLADLAVGYATRRLENAEFPPDQPLAGEGIRASVCRECPMVVRGSLCGDPECFSRKEEAWYRQRLGVLSERLGVALLLPQERRQMVNYRHFERDMQASLAHSLSIKCPHLRLTLRQPYESQYLGPEEDPGAIFVCIRSSGGCSCQRPQVSTPKETRRQGEALRRQAVAAFTSAILEGHPWALRAILSYLDHPNEDKIRKMDARSAAERIAALLIEWRALPWTTNPEFADARFHEWAMRLGLEGPGDLSDPLAPARRTWARLEAFIARLQRELPLPDHIRDATNDLIGLKVDLEYNHPDNPEAAAILAEVSRALEMMEELHPIVYRWDGGGFEEIQNLINIPAEDPNFRTALSRAPLPALRYALALVRGRDGHKARQETLEREIRKREQ